MSISNNIIIRKINDIFVDIMVNKKFKIVRHFGIQIFLFMLSINCFQDENETFVFSIKGLISSSIMMLILNFYTYFNILYLIPKYFDGKNLKKYFKSILFLGISFIVIMIISIFFQINELEKRGFFAAFLNVSCNFLDVLFIICTTTSLIFYKRSLEQRYKFSELKNSTFNTELKMLKQQINPHFLFNMINNINVLTYKKPYQAQDILFKLEDLLKYQFNDTQKDEVDLKDDVDFLEHFLKLEDIRRTNFTYNIETEGDISEIKIPPLLFIPFVENAVKHNGDPENGSFVNIKFTCSENSILFECVNSKSNYNVEKSKVGGIGLTNIRRRLELLYPNNHTFEINDNENTFEVKLRIEQG